LSLNQPLPLDQFIESQKTKFAVEKGTDARNEYITIITPYANRIISLEVELNAVRKNQSKNKRVKIIKQKKTGKK